MDRTCLWESTWILGLTLILDLMRRLPIYTPNDTSKNWLRFEDVIFKMIKRSFTGQYLQKVSKLKSTLHTNINSTLVDWFEQKTPETSGRKTCPKSSNKWEKINKMSALKSYQATMSVNVRRWVLLRGGWRCGWPGWRWRWMTADEPRTEEPGEELSRNQPTHPCRKITHPIHNESILSYLNKITIQHPFYFVTTPMHSTSFHFLIILTQ